MHYAPIDPRIVRAGSSTGIWTFKVPRKQIWVGVFCWDPETVTPFIPKPPSNLYTLFMTKDIIFIDCIIYNSCWNNYLGLWAVVLRRIVTRFV